MTRYYRYDAAGKPTSNYRAVYTHSLSNTPTIGEKWLWLSSCLHTSKLSSEKSHNLSRATQLWGIMIRMQLPPNSPVPKPAFLGCHGASPSRQVIFLFFSVLAACLSIQMFLL